MSEINEGTRNVMLGADWLDGVRAAAEYAHNNYADPQKEDIMDGVIAAKVREKAGL